MIYSIRGEHANHYTTGTVNWLWIYRQYRNIMTITVYLHTRTTLLSL